jgi:large subunit ribosomal protein L30
MIAIIRIEGQVKVAKEVKITFERLNLGKKFACTLMNETPEKLGMLQVIRSGVAYGKIDKETLKELIEKRGRPLKKNAKIDAEKLTEEILNSKIDRTMKDFGLKPIFSLHPPRGGLKSSKLYYPKGVLGDNKEGINALIRRML